MTLAHTLHGHGPEPVLMLHDWLGDVGNYEPAMRYFDPELGTWAHVDLPGYGACRALPLVGTGPELDAAVVNVADTLGWKRFHIVSHSMSTVIAQRLARAIPERLGSVILVAPVTPGTELSDETIEFLRGVARDPGRRRGALASRLSARWVDVKLARWATSAEPETIAAYVALFARPELPTARAGVPVPMLVVTGAEDAAPFRREAVEAKIAGVYPDAAFEVCASAGHYPMEQTPPLFAALVDRFVRAHPTA